MKFFDAFSGIGGFHFGIKNAFKSKQSSEPCCIDYSEIDKYATSVYEKRFKGVKC